MRIVIDMQSLQTNSRYRGIGRYTMSFVQAVLRNRGQHDVYLVLSGLYPEPIKFIRSALQGQIEPEKILVWHAPGPLESIDQRNNNRIKIAEILREAFIYSLRPDVVHMPSVFEGHTDNAVISIGKYDKATPSSVTLHDLIPLISESNYLKYNLIYRNHYFNKLEYIKKADICLCISGSALQEGIKYSNLAPAKLVNTGEGADQVFQWINLAPSIRANFLASYKVKKDFILYTGGFDNRKNLLNLLKAYAALPTSLRDKYQLVFVGQTTEQVRSTYKDLIGDLGLKADDLVLTGYVSDLELAYFYNLCDLFVFPSKHEGFGLPVLEAMACGAAVIGSNTTSIPEVIGLDAALFDPYDVNSIKNKMAEVLGDDDFKSSLRAHGINRAKSFSWDITAQKAIDAWQTLGKKDEPFVANNIYKEIIKYIDAKDDKQLNELAKCIALNQRNGLSRQLLIDISSLIDQESGITNQIKDYTEQSVNCTEQPQNHTDLYQNDDDCLLESIKKLLQEKYINIKPNIFDIKLVYAKNNNYYYANAYMAKLLNDIGLQDEPISLQYGDVFFLNKDHPAKIEYQQQLNVLVHDLNHQVVNNLHEYLIDNYKRNTIYSDDADIIADQLTNIISPAKKQKYSTKVICAVSGNANQAITTIASQDVATAAVTDIKRIDFVAGDILIINNSTNLLEYASYYKFLDNIGVKIIYLLDDAISINNLFNNNYSSEFKAWFDIANNTGLIRLVTKN